MGDVTKYTIVDTTKVPCRRCMSTHAPQYGNVVCDICGDPHGLDGTRLCHGCWELKTRLDDALNNSTLRRYVLDRVAACLE